MLKKVFKVILVLMLVGIVFTAALNILVCFLSKDKMRSVSDSLNDKGYDCIIVLGCGVRGNSPTPLLSDRLDAAVELYKAGVAPKILMSGDHGQEDYDEVSVMRQYAIDRGVPSEDIFMDHAGFSTYETMYRAQSIFGIHRAVVVTQKYHLFRALFDASAFGMEVKGTMAVGHEFAAMPRWEAREVLARCKDVFWCLIKPDPTYGGDKIDIKGNGEVTIG